MIYITGDIHGEIDIKKLSNKNWQDSKKMTPNDYLIVCGDFGLPFLPSDANDEPLSNHIQKSSRSSYLYWIKWLSERPYTILWCDGNHDNHKFWAKQEVTEWNGGKVHIHPKAKNVIHLMRGEYYTIDGHTFWVMGGAESHDKEMRIPDFSWWEEEIPSYQEMMHGMDTLEAHNNEVDFIISHTMPQDLIAPIFHTMYKSEPTRTYFNEIYARTKFKHWFCGHFHQNVNNKMYKMQVLYEDIVNIDDYSH